MPSQHDYDKVNRCMIAPLCIQFGLKRMDDAVVDGYVEELAKYSEETLKTAFKTLRRECKRSPSLAQVIEACAASAPRKTTTSATPQNKNELKKDLALAERVMQSPIGQFAIAQGVGSSVYLYAYRDSREITKESEVIAIRNAWQEAIDRLAGMPEKEFPHLYKMYVTLSQREKEIAEKYTHKQMGIAA